MTPERWKQIEEVFQTALDLPAAERPGFVAEACGADEDLRRQVEALIAQHDEAGDFIEEAAVNLSGLIRADGDPLATNPTTGGISAENPAIGRRVGSYRIVGELGRGGMGAVYLAERADSAFRLRVAVKLIKRGMDTDFILRRFRHERQILASLDHPNIARLLDGGTTDDDLPYFVMEFIDGLPLFEYCDARRLNVDERLRLFARICAAVDYAHRSLVIHRDIKPSNILVTAGGTPKLLDFGIAKVLNPDMADTTLDPTATAMRLMTPEYASPEQVQGQSVTPATDVYSLGVLLYELLTGHRPYHLRSRAPHDVARVICEEEPPHPSAVVSSREDLIGPRGETADPEAALERLMASRGATVPALRAELSGDLDNIVLKALRKDPAARYQTAEELRQDIERRLAGRPVTARPVPAAPRASARLEPQSDPDEKSLAILPLKLLDPRADDDTGDDYLGVGLADALITRLSSLRRFSLRPTSSVLRFGGADVDPLAAGRELNVAFVLDGRMHRAGHSVRVTMQLLDVRSGSAVWAGKFDEKFTDVLQIEDAISAQVAEALLPELTGGERLRLAKRGTDSVEAHEAYLRGRYHWNTFSEEGLARALTHFHEAVAIDPNYALPHAGIADYFNWLGVYCVLPFAETAAAAKDAALRAVALDATLAEGYAALGFATLTRDFDWRGGEANCRRALELNPHYATAHVWHGYQLMMEGRFEEAFTAARSAARLDPLSPMTLHMLTWSNYQARRYSEAASCARRLVSVEPRHSIARLFLGRVLSMTGEHDEALREGRRAAEMFGRTPYSLQWLAMIHATAGEPDEARALLREIDEAEASRYVSPYLSALVRAVLGERERALELLEEAYSIRDAWLLWIGVDPLLDPVRDEPRFRELLRLTNNPAAALSDVTTSERPTLEQKSIAVLPLQMLNPSGTGDDYLGVGLADALITRLSNVRRFVVRPTSSVLRFGHGDADPFAAGRELSVSFVLDGHVQRADTRLRVSVQLLDVDSRSTVWAEAFDEESTDVLTIQDDISTKVAEALIPRLSGDERRRLAKRGTDNPEAFQAYLRGRYHLSGLTPEGFAKAVASFERALDLDPGYALAHVGIAEVFFCRAAFADATPRDCGELIRARARRALDLDDALGEAYAVLGFVAHYHDLDRAEAARLLARAVELSPSHATARVLRSVVLVGGGDFDAALGEARRAAELDPISPFNRQHLSWILYHARRHDEALASARAVAADAPAFGHGRAVLGWMLRRQGRHAEAAEQGRRAVELSPDTPWIIASLAASLAADGRADEARELLGRLEGFAASRYATPFVRGVARLHLGETDEAFKLLDEAVETRDVWLAWLTSEPQLDPLRGDPRFAALLGRAGASAESARTPAPDGPAQTVRPTAAAASPPTAAAAPRTSAGPPQPRPTTDEQARQFYVAGRYYATRRTAEGLSKAIERLEQAVERDPNFALAYAELADCYALLNWYVEPAPPDAWERAKWAAESAVRADDLLAEAHASLGFVTMHFDRDFARAEAELRRAVELQPENAVARRWHAFNLSAMGRHEEAVTEIKRAQGLSPRSPVMATAVGNVLFLARRFDEAIEQCQRALELDGGAVAAYVVLRWAYEHKGMRDEALSAFEQESVFAGDTPTTRAKQAHVLAATGRPEEARRVIEGLVERRASEWVTAYEIAVVYTLIGDRDEALRWLSEAARERAVGFTFARVDPHLDAVRPDPRFAQLLRANGMSSD